MAKMIRSPGFIRFGLFEVDLKNRELRKRGLKIKLQQQPFEVLVALLERPGEIVTLDELRQRIWPEDMFVDFEHSLRTAILKIRTALGDHTANPGFIETIPRHGYRFIAPVQAVSNKQASSRLGPSIRRKLRWSIQLATVTALVFTTVWYFVFRPEDRPPENLLTATPLTSSPGGELMPSFSPDGNQVAYTCCDEGAWVLTGNCDIVVKLIGTESSLLLTEYPWVDQGPAWSPDGRHIAFLRNPPEGMASYYLIPAIGGQERMLTETFPPMPPPTLGTAISWFPDGKHISIIVRDSSDGPRKIAVFSVETGERRALTTPPPKSYGDKAPAVSPDGGSIAFVREGTGRDNLSDIYLLKLSDDLTSIGEPQLLLANLTQAALAWMPDGDAIIFSSGGSLWRMGVSAGRGARPERLAFGGQQVSDPALSRDGQRLAYSQGIVREDIWHVELTNTGEVAGSPRELISSTRQDGYPQYSPDGIRIAFLSNRSGIRQLYVCDADGSNLVQLTSFAAGVELPYPGWSPDGKSLCFTANVEGNQDVFWIDLRRGSPRRLTTEASTDSQPQWSQDGGWIYFTTNRTGEPQIWKIPAGGGAAVQVTHNGGGCAFESPDGKFLYYIKPGSGGAEQLYKLQLSGGEESLVLEEVFWLNFSMSGEGIYFIPQRDSDCDCYHLQWLDCTTGKSKPVIDVKNVGGGLSVSSDGHSLLYTKVVHFSTDLMLVENFH